MRTDPAKNCSGPALLERLKTGGPLSGSLDGSQDARDQLEDLDFDEPWIVVDANVDGELRFPPVRGAPESVDLRNVMFYVPD